MREGTINENLFNKNPSYNSQSRSSSSSNNRKKSRSRTNSKDNKNKVNCHYSRSIYKNYTLEYNPKIIKIAEDHTLSYIEKNNDIVRHLVRK